MKIRRQGVERLQPGASPKGKILSVSVRLASAMSFAALGLALAAIVLIFLRWRDAQEPWTVLSALSSVVVPVVAVAALQQWRTQARTMSQRSAATDVLERAYENQELFWEISRHTMSCLLSRSFLAQVVESDAVLGAHLESMLAYTAQVRSLGARLDAALFKASVICGFQFPVEQNDLVPMEAGVVWGWMTSMLIKARTFPEKSSERTMFLETKISEIKKALDEAPEPMRKAREELRKALRPYFEI